MSLELRSITSENWRDAVFLSTDPKHLCPIDEEWIASNAFSLVQAAYEPQWICRLIVADDKPVGFAFYGLDDGVPCLCRYMIDAREQGKGYGKAALALVVEEMRRQFDSQEIWVTIEKKNERALHLYESFGFQDSGKQEYTESWYVLR